MSYLFARRDESSVDDIVVEEDIVRGREDQERTIVVIEQQLEITAKKTVTTAQRKPNKL